MGPTPLPYFGRIAIGLRFARSKYYETLKINTHYVIIIIRFLCQFVLCRGENINEKWISIEEEGGGTFSIKSATVRDWIKKGKVFLLTKLIKG